MREEDVGPLHVRQYGEGDPFQYTYRALQRIVVGNDRAVVGRLESEL